MLIKALFGIALFSILAATVSAAPLHVVYNRYIPGYVDYPTEISFFAPPGLVTACDALKRGEYDVARPIFANEIRLHPGDFAASLGFLQTASEQWNRLLPLYQKAVKEHDGAANEFRLGVLAWYIQGSPSVGFNMAKAGKRQQLARVARRGLQRAYELSHAPIVGFTLAYAYGYIGGGDGKGLYEDMLGRVGGEDGYSAYLNAKKSNWVGPQPPIPDYDRHRLLVTREIVGEIWADYGTLLNDKPVYPDGQPAIKFLDEWRVRLKTAAAQRN